MHRCNMSAQSWKMCATSSVRPCLGAVLADNEVRVIIAVAALAAVDISAVDVLLLLLLLAGESLRTCTQPKSEQEF